MLNQILLNLTIKIHGCCTKFKMFRRHYIIFLFFFLFPVDRYDHSNIPDTNKSQFSLIENNMIMI